MIARAATATVVCLLALSLAGAARADARLVLHAPAGTGGPNHSRLGYASAQPPRATDPPSASSSPASDRAANPLGSGTAILVLVVIGGAFLWLRSRALRR